MSSLMSDTTFAIRQLRKHPGFTAVALLSLALGIGVNTAIFSLLNAVWLRSLPVRNPHALRVVNWSGHNARLSHFRGNGYVTRSGARVEGSFPYPVYRDFKKRVTECSVFAFTNLPRLTVIGPAGAAITDGLLVSGDFFSGYGAKVLIGRPLMPADESPSADPVAVITHRWWEKHYRLNPHVIGQTITVNQHPFTIAGVLPPGYRGPLMVGHGDIYMPMSAQPKLFPGHPLDARDHWWVQIMARLQPGAKESQVAAAMEAIFLQTLSAPGQKTEMDQPRILLTDGSRGPLMIRRRMVRPLALLMVAVGLVLLIACTNLAGLLLARGAARQQELAVRTAMGAGRARLIRQLLTESLLLAMGGAALGLLMALWMKSAILGFLNSLSLPVHLDVVFDMRVLWFTFGTALVTVVLFGLLPALRATRVDPSSGLKGSRILGAPSLRLGKFLVAGQIGLSVLLVIGMGLLMRTLINLYQVDPGFNPERLLVFRLNPGHAGYGESERLRFYDRLQTDIAGLPGVRHVALSNAAILGGGRSSNAFSIPGRAQDRDGHLHADTLSVSGTFFDAMGISLLSGNTFDMTLTAGQAPAAIVNRAFVQSVFPDEDPLGRIFHMGTDYRIVGVCADAKYNRLQRTIEPTVYFSHRQAPPGATYFKVRSVLEPLSLVPAVRKIVTDLDRSIPISEIATQSRLLKTSIAPERLFTTLCGVMALVGILLSCIGLYGLLAFMVTRRTNEIGVRMALGARPRDVAWPLIRSALRLATLGLAFGLPTALALTRVLRSVLYGVTPHDPMTVAASIALILAIAALAAWIPARRAARIDPMEALRYE